MRGHDDLPACPACGCRNVHVIQRMPGDVPKDRPGFRGVNTFFACRQCGRDQTAAWTPIQPRNLQ